MTERADIGDGEDEYGGFGTDGDESGHEDGDHGGGDGDASNSVVPAAGSSNESRPSTNTRPSPRPLVRKRNYASINSTQPEDDLLAILKIQMLQENSRREEERIIRAEERAEEGTRREEELVQERARSEKEDKKHDQFLQIMMLSLTRGFTGPQSALPNPHDSHSADPAPPDDANQGPRNSKNGSAPGKISE